MNRDTSKIGCWMSKSLLTVDNQTTVIDALDMMHKNNCRHLLVVENGKLFGVVSNQDLHNAMKSKNNFISNIVHRDVKTVRFDDSVKKALKHFISKKYDILPVVDSENKLMGVVSVHDLLIAFEVTLNEYMAQRVSSIQPY